MINAYVFMLIRYISIAYINPTLELKCFNKMLSLTHLRNRERVPRRKIDHNIYCNYQQNRSPLSPPQHEERLAANPSCLV